MLDIMFNITKLISPVCLFYCIFNMAPRKLYIMWFTLDFSDSAILEYFLLIINKLYCWTLKAKSYRYQEGSKLSLPVNRP